MMINSMERHNDNRDLEEQQANIGGGKQVENKNVTIIKNNIRCMIVAFVGFAIIFAFLLLC